MAAMFLGRRQITPSGGTRGPAWDDHVATTPWIGGNQVMINGDSRVTSPTEESQDMTHWRGGRNVSEERNVTAVSGKNEGNAPWRREKMVNTKTEERNVTARAGKNQGNAPWRREEMVNTQREERNMTAISEKSQVNAAWREERNMTASTEERNVIHTSGKSHVITPTIESRGTSSWRGGRKVTTTTEETHVTTVTAKSQVFTATGKSQVASPRKFGRQITTVEESSVASSTGKTQENPTWRGGGKVNALADERIVTKTVRKNQVPVTNRGGKATPAWLSGGKENTVAEEENVRVTTTERQITATSKTNPTPAWLSGGKENTVAEEENVRVATTERQITATSKTNPTPAWRKERKVTSAESKASSTSSTWKSQVPPTPVERKKVATVSGEKKVITTSEEQIVLTEVQNTRVDFHRLASPHLAKSEVLKMLTEQEQSHHGYQDLHDHRGHHVQQMDWPPPGHDHPSSFFTAIETNEVKKVAWPPVEPVEDGDQPLREYQAVHSVQRHKNSPPPPSTMALRQEIPLRQPPQEVYQSTPTAKKNPKPWRGDLKWPPEYCREVPEELQPKKEIVKPKRQRKDYTNFFAAHELPNNYPAYRVPPGTQYYGTQANIPGHSDM